MGSHSSKAKGKHVPTHDHRASSAVHVQDINIVSQDADQFVIPCKLWKSTAQRPPRAVVLYIHGGTFSQGDADSHVDMTRAFVAHAGLAILTCSFRDGATATYASGKWLADLKACVVWLSQNYAQLPLGLMGSSSGGWFAMAVANQIEWHGLFQFCVLVCPVAHPHARAIYLQHCCQGTTPLATGKELYSVRHSPEKAASMLQRQLQFFESYKQMAFAAERVAHNVHHIPTLLFLGAQDANIPMTAVQGVIQAWAWKTVIVGPAGHELHDEPPATGSFDCIVVDLNRFLRAVVLGDDDNVITTSKEWPCWLPWCR